MTFRVDGDIPRVNIPAPCSMLRVGTDSGATPASKPSSHSRVKRHITNSTLRRRASGVSMPYPAIAKAPSAREGNDSARNRRALDWRSLELDALVRLDILSSIHPRAVSASG